MPGLLPYHHFALSLRPRPSTPGYPPGPEGHTSACVTGGLISPETRFPRGHIFPAKNTRLSPEEFSVIVAKILSRQNLE